jgi:cell shape-determining protein MreD
MIAALLQSPVARLVPIGIVLVALQATLFVELHPFGVILPILTVLVAAAGAAGGSERGALAGFLLGVMFDLRFGTELGSSAIAMGVAGVVGGWAVTTTVDPQWWLAGLFTSLGTAAGEAMNPVVDTFIGRAEAFDEHLVTVLPVVAVAGFVLSPIAVPVARWCLRAKRPEWKAPAV